MENCHLPASDISSLEVAKWSCCLIQICSGTLSQLLTSLCEIQVPSGLSIVLYDAEGFEGQSITFKGPETVGCLVSSGWNDRARSMKIVAV